MNHSNLIYFSQQFMKLSPSFLTVIVPRESQAKKELLEIKDFYNIGTYCSVEFDPKNLSIEVKKKIIFMK